MIKTESVTRLILTTDYVDDVMLYYKTGEDGHHKEGKLFGLYCSVGYAVNFDDLVCIS